jgi:hypothetical protein
MITLKHKYTTQKTSARNRGIAWHFTYESWIAWWGDDIVNRGRCRSQLVMARNGDSGPYAPGNVHKTTCGGNILEANLGRPLSLVTRAIMSTTRKTSAATEKRRTPIQTPLGLFSSRDAAAKAHKISPAGIGKRCTRDPVNYYKVLSTIV